MPDRFAAQVERFLLDRMDDLTEIRDAHASAQHATSWGRGTRRPCTSGTRSCSSSPTTSPP